MHQIVKKAALLLPPLRRLVAQRDQLLEENSQLVRQIERLARAIEAAQLEERIRWRRHRPYTVMNAQPAIGSGTEVNDEQIVERLLKAYRHSSLDQYGSDSLWRDFFETYQRDAHEVFMRADVEQAHEILANPATNNMFYGFDELCLAWLKPFHADKQTLASMCQDNLIRLAEAIGVYRLDNAETEQWLTHTATPTDDVVRAIEAALGTELTFPNIYYGAVGVLSCRGIVTYRAVQALYLAFRVRQVLEGSGCNNAQSSVCEIGAGLGRSALYAHVLGVKDYTLVDVPMTTISQGYFLMRCLGADAVVLPGETRRNHEQIHLMHAEEFFASEASFDLIVNVDSLTEFGHDLAMRYLRTISAKAPVFLSINHEVNTIRVFDLLKELEQQFWFARHPYWMRDGYAEELVRFRT